MRYIIWIYAESIFAALGEYTLGADVYNSKEEAERVRVVKGNLRLFKITTEEDNKHA